MLSCLKMFMEKNNVLWTLSIQPTWQKIFKGIQHLITIGVLHMNALFNSIIPKQPTQKQICKTLANRVQQLQFIETYFETKGLLKETITSFLVAFCAKMIMSKILYVALQ
jgi:hypothetical protein